MNGRESLEVLRHEGQRRQGDKDHWDLEKKEIGGENRNERI